MTNDIEQISFYLKALLYLKHSKNFLFFYRNKIILCVCNKINDLSIILVYKRIFITKHFKW